jgi:NH3-dependent NAD+ synthetase
VDGLGVDIMPLANLLKKDVVELARNLGISKKILENLPLPAFGPARPMRPRWE